MGDNTVSIDLKLSISFDFGQLLCCCICSSVVLIGGFPMEDSINLIGQETCLGILLRVECSMYSLHNLLQFDHHEMFVLPKRK